MSRRRKRQAKVRFIVLTGVVPAVVILTTVVLGAAIAESSWMSSSTERLAASSDAVDDKTPAPLAPTMPLVAGDATSPEAVEELAGRAAIKVIRRRCGTRTVGTGFVAAVGGRNVVATNHHIAGSATKLSLVTGVGEIEVEVEKVSKSKDLAVAYLSELQLDEINRPVLALAEPPPVASMLAISGFPRGRDLAVVNGTVQTTVPGAAYGFDAEVILANGVAVPGMSGGPILDETGAAVGVVAAVDRSTGLVVGVTAAELLKLVDDDGIGQRPVPEAAC